MDKDKMARDRDKRQFFIAHCTGKTPSEKIKFLTNYTREVRGILRGWDCQHSRREYYNAMLAAAVDLLIETTEKLEKLVEK